MSNRTFPHYVGKIQSTRALKPDELCEICGVAATCFVAVQHTWFRSDDSYYKVCDEHRKLMRTQTAELVAKADENRRQAVRAQVQHSEVRKCP